MVAQKNNEGVGKACLGHKVVAVSLLFQGLLCFGECVWEGLCNSSRYLTTEAVFLAPDQILGVAAGVESVGQVCGSGYNNTQLFVMLLGVLTVLACLQRRSYSVPLKRARGHCPFLPSHCPLPPSPLISLTPESSACLSITEQL